jgi:hypothetical protein
MPFPPPFHRRFGSLDLWIFGSPENAGHVVTVLQEFGSSPDTVSTSMITDEKGNDTATHDDLWKLLQRKNRAKVLGDHTRPRVLSLAPSPKIGVVGDRTRFSTRASKTTCEGACAPLECLGPLEPFPQILMRGSISRRKIHQQAQPSSSSSAAR